MSARLLECSICLQEYNSGQRMPKALPCQHTLCAQCLMVIVRDKACIVCPTCRETSLVPAGGIARIPNNYTIMQLLDEGRHNDTSIPRTMPAMPASGVAFPESYPDCSRDGNNQHSQAAKQAYVASLGFPTGIAEEFLRSIEDFPMRYWVIDNSGSMTTGDGHELVQTVGYEAQLPISKLVSCSRWKELSQTLKWAGDLAINTSARTEFRLLNPANGVQTVLLGQGSPDLEQYMLDQLVSSTPAGKTPICEQIRQVTASVRAQVGQARFVLYSLRPLGLPEFRWRYGGF